VDFALLTKVVFFRAMLYTLDILLLPEREEIGSGVLHVVHLAMLAE
jgi:hypothetical protein